jgi:hypothetical protein
LQDCEGGAEGIPEPPLPGSYRATFLLRGLALSAPLVFQQPGPAERFTVAAASRMVELPVPFGDRFLPAVGVV